LYDIGLLAILSGAIEKHGKHRLLYDINNQTGGGYVEVCKVAIGAKGVLRRYDDWGRRCMGVIGGFDIVHDFCQESRFRVSTVAVVMHDESNNNYARCLLQSHVPSTVSVYFECRATHQSQPPMPLLLPLTM
jgi:hypothetical protein